MNYDPNIGVPINKVSIPEKQNTIALVSMIFSLLGFNIISLIMGLIGLSRVKKTNNGLVFSIVAIILSGLETIGIVFIISIAIINYPNLKNEANQIVSNCSVAYECEIKNKVESNCKYRDYNGIEIKIVCPSDLLNDTQYKTKTTEKKNS